MIFALLSMKTSLNELNWGRLDILKLTHFCCVFLK